MLAKRLPTIMPDITLAEAIETTKITRGIAQRSINPHHPPVPLPASHNLRCGLSRRYRNPNPGEVSLAHNGVFFLDELPEFRRSILEVMRQPLEDGQHHSFTGDGLD